jgi:hypothetical protein
MTAQAGYTAATDGADAAMSMFARLASSSGGRSLDPNRLASDSGDTPAAETAGSTDGDGLVDQGILAFQALLAPAPAPDPQTVGQGPQQKGGAAVGHQMAPEAGASLSGSRLGSRSTHDADPSLASAVRPAADSSAIQAEPAAHGLSMVAPVATASAGAGSGATASMSTNQHQAASHAPADLFAWDAADVAPKAALGGAAREIQLELRDSDARVSVRLVERAGSVQVDVRTPDSHLAGSLRDDLPALTARLEQSGLRAETWHDAPAASAARIKMAEPVVSTGFQSSQNQSREGGGRDPRDGQPQEKRQKQNQPEPKEFSWLYTSLT